jgi:protein-arginine kinase activator protein McsA
MMNTRAKASIFLGQGKFPEAITEIKRGCEAIAEFFQKSHFPELAAKSSEIHFLNDWLEDVPAKRPRTKLELMEREMETAVAKELYERAAEIRDAITRMKSQSVT